MGYYINPPTGTKEQWLNENGIMTELNLPPKTIPDDPSLVLVCLVVNTHFNAAGVVYSDEELEAFNQPTDFRPKYWFLVDKANVLEVCPEVASELR